MLPGWLTEDFWASIEECDTYLLDLYRRAGHQLVSHPYVPEDRSHRRPGTPKHHYVRKKGKPEPEPKRRKPLTLEEMQRHYHRLWEEERHAQQVAERVARGGAGRCTN